MSAAGHLKLKMSDDECHGEEGGSPVLEKQTVTHLTFDIDELGKH